MTTQSRGIRNNNPGNIRKGQDWQGLSKTQTDESFDQFDTPEYGIRAIEKILLSYKARGLDTVKEIITTWAPYEENNTPAYIKAVCDHMGLTESAPLNVEDISVAELLIEAIILHENGSQPYSKDTITKGIMLAGITPTA